MKHLDKNKLELVKCLSTVSLQTHVMFQVCSGAFTKCNICKGQVPLVTCQWGRGGQHKRTIIGWDHPREDSDVCDIKRIKAVYVSNLW